jgi:predicted lipid-binding transport protein (Tim44 family)
VLIAKVAASSTMIEMSFTAEARRVASAAASGQAGRADQGASRAGRSGSQAAPAPRRTSTAAPNGSARSRAEQDPIVQRMKEKFGAEIRTVIDYREKG